jgi:integrase
MFDELLRGLERDYEIRGLHSLRSLQSHLAHVREFFANDRAIAVTTERLRDFVAHQQRAGVSPQSIHHQLKAIRRAFKLAAGSNLVAFAPAVPTITVRNARQGFLSRAEFEAIVTNLGELRGRGEAKGLELDRDLVDFTEWSWWTGMRKGETARLTWAALDRETWTLRLHARDAKTGQGRTLALTGPLRKVIDRRIAARRLDCPLIFHRTSRVKVGGEWQDQPGQPVTEFRKTWASALKRAGLAGVRFHDLRRSAIRNLVRAGVDPAVAMKISGHRTRAVFDRYNIVSEEDLAQAMQKVSDYVAALPRERKVEPMEGRR